MYPNKHNLSSSLPSVTSDISYSQSTISPPIYFNVKLLPSNSTNNDADNQNMMLNSSTIVIWLDLEKDMVNYSALPAAEIIRRYRCNSVLDLQGRKIPNDKWKEIEECILTQSWIPPIKKIDLKDTGITWDQIDPKIIKIVSIVLL